MGRHLTCSICFCLLFILNIVLVHSKAVIWRAYTSNSLFCNYSPDSVYISYIYSSGIKCSSITFASTCTLSPLGYDSYIERCIEIDDSLNTNDPSVVPPWSGEFIEIRSITSSFKNCTSSLLTSTNVVKGYYKNNICVLGNFSPLYKSRVTVTSTFAELYEACQVDSCTSSCTGNSPNRAYPSSSQQLYCTPTTTTVPILYRTVLGVNNDPTIAIVNTVFYIILSSVIGATLCIICCCVLCCVCIIGCCVYALKKSTPKHTPTATTTTVVNASQYVPPTIQNAVPQQSSNNNYYYYHPDTTVQQQQQQQAYYSQAYYATTPQQQQQQQQQQVQAYPTQYYSTDGSNLYSHAYTNPTEMIQYHPTTTTPAPVQDMEQQEMHQPLMEQMHTPQQENE